MNVITIDCALLSNREEFHQAMAQALSFPEWYGKNLDALHDSLCAVSRETELQLLHWDALSHSVGLCAAAARKVLCHAAEKNPCLNVTFL